MVTNLDVFKMEIGTRKIANLESMRFLFALMVFFHHFLVIDGRGLFDVGGSCAVSFFFITSGFVMTAGYGAKVAKPGFVCISFLKKRLIRLYPLHLLSLLVLMPGILCALISHHEIHYGIAAYLTADLLLLQSWIPKGEAYFFGNPVSWFLSDMLFFYVLFPIVIRIANKLSKSCRYLLFLSMFGCYFMALFFVPQRLVSGLFYINPLFRMVDFMIGIALYRLLFSPTVWKYRNGICQMSFIAKSAVEISCVILFVLVIVCAGFVPDRYSAACYFWLPMSVLITVFVSLDGAGGVISEILSNRILVFLGSLSFTFYMIHLLVIHYFGDFLLKQNINMAWKWSIPVYIISITLLSYLINRYYEKPIASFFNNKTKMNKHNL